MEPIKIEDYIELYNKGYTVDKIKPLHNQTYKVFSLNKDIKVVPRSFINSNPLAFSRIKKFLQENEFFYMIPVKTPNETIIGFILRGITKKSYTTVSREFKDKSKQVPLMFGFDKKFLSYDKKEKCYPIIICEGCKDCIVLKRFYPYVLANNTSSMGLNAHILRNISNKFLLAYDNDQAGMKGIELDKKKLRGMGAYVSSINISSNYKDCSDCVVNKDGTINKQEYKKLKTQVMKKLRELYKI